MAKITYNTLLGPYGEIESFYDETLLQLQGQKSSETKVIYKGEDQNKITLTGTGLTWEDDFLSGGNITGITFTRPCGRIDSGIGFGVPQTNPV